MIQMIDLMKEINDDNNDDGHSDSGQVCDDAFMWSVLDLSNVTDSISEG